MHSQSGDTQLARRQLLARMLEQERLKSNQAQEIVRRTPGDAGPVSFAQWRLWLLDQMAPGDPSYHMPAALRMSGAVDVARLQQVFDDLVQRHESLQTAFTAVDGRPVPVIAAHPTLLPLIDVPDDPAHIADLMRQEVRRPFDLATGPLLRALLLRLGAQEHILLVTLHHIVADGWSIAILMREFASLYAARAAGRLPALPALPVQYGDYARWQQERLRGEVLQRLLAYWQKQLHDLPALQLFTDYPRPAVRSNRGARVEAPIPAELTAALRSLSRAAGVTLYMTLLTAFVLLLYRYSEQADIAVGTPVSGRGRPEIEGLIGFFVNSIILRLDLSGNPPVRALLAQVHRVATEAFAHQELPFEQLVGVLQPERSLSHTPLFQVMFALQPVALQPMNLPGLSLRPLPLHHETAKFDLTLEIAEGAADLCAGWEYSLDLFTAARIERMAGHYSLLLAAMVAQPDGRATDLPLLTGAERELLLVTHNDTAVDYPRDLCLHEHVERQVARRADAVALVGNDGEALTYQALDRRANQVAHRLRALGLRPGAHVGLLLERSPEMVVGMLGVLKAGGVYVPLDPTYPPERLAWMMADAALAALICQRALALDGLPDHPPRICLDDAREEADAASAPLSPFATDAAGAAYLMYTSGSTGRPKGVVVSHRAIARLVLQTNYLQIRPSDRVAQASNASFDAATFEIWGALLNGACLVMLSQELLLSPQRLAAAIATGQFTILFLTTALFTYVAGAAPGAFAPLRGLLFGGEAADAAAVRRVLRAGPPACLLNMYGPTETTTFATCYSITADAPEATAIPIGRPIANTTCYVLDAHMQPVPMGVPGELYIGGDGLANGYLNQPALTAERFVPNPFSSRAQRPGDRLYRTGDRVSYLPDGNLLFLGRYDQQIKLRGFRIELGEIEATLLQHAAVSDAAVIVRTEQHGQQRLVAYAAPHGTPDEAPAWRAEDLARLAVDLRAHLSQRLPAYMQPSGLTVLPHLPLTANGKVDRQALAALPVERADAGYVAPSTPVEEVVAALWCEVLAVQRVGRHDHFFEMGGNSLLATQVVSRLRTALQIDLSLRDLFEAPTVATLAEKAEARLRSDAAEHRDDVALEPAARDSALPLSFAQQRLWFIDQLQPGDTAYHIPLAVRLSGQLDAAALGQSLWEIVQRHESLRTAFAAVDGEPVQRILPEPRFRLEMIYLPPGERAWERAVEVASAEARRPFDLTSGSLLRASLLRVGPTEHLLVLVMHHIASDGWSLGVLVRELAACYAALVAGEPIALPSLPIQYADVAIWQRRWLQGARLQRQLRYWKERLAGLPRLELPTEQPRSEAHHPVRGASQSMRIPAELTRLLKELSAREGATLFMTLLAAFLTLLYRYTGQEDIGVGTPIANRTRRETEGLIGFFVNTLVMRGDLTGRPTFRELLARVREMTIGAYLHQDLPFEQLVSELNPERSLSHHPLFQALFALQNAPLAPLQLPGLALEPIAIPAETTRFDFELHLWEVEQQVTGLLVYNTALFAERMISALMGHFLTLLAGIVTAPDTHLTELPLLTAAERAAMRRTWSDTVAAYPSDSCVHERFEAQVAQTPDAIALSDEGESLTYRELNNRANQVAHALRRRGIGSEMAVGICAERSLEMIVGVIAILKAGGAYLPLDPTYPPERLAYMLQDANATLLLTQQRLLTRLPLERPDLQHLCLDADWPVIATEPTSNPQSGAAPENPAFLIYTSGSTGWPKGVLMPHRGLVNLIDWERKNLVAGAGSKTLQFTTLSFDVSFQEIFSTLTTGGELLLMREAQRQDLTTLPQLLQARGIERLYLPFVALQQLAEAAVIWNCYPTALREVITAGEQLQITPALVELFEKMASCTLHNVYGPTETHAVTRFTLTGPPRNWPSLPPIGTPFQNVYTRILDRHLQPVPVGARGELCLGGDCLARGYHGRPALTAERFIPDPFAPYPGARIYRTGDLARYLPNGHIEFLGRIDQQVKMRGYRVEPGEIETALAAHPAVREAVVAVRGEGPSKQLVAYVLPVDAQADGAWVRATLNAYLKERLPAYMIPSAFVLMERFALTPSGKVDRRALPAPTERPGAAAEAQRAPATAMEQALLQIWRHLLQQERIGLDENFFDLGAHSLLLVRVRALIMQQLGIDLPLTDLFKYPTIRTLAAALSARTDGGGPNQAVAPPAFAPSATAAGADAGIAIIGMACRFPMSPDLHVYWQNLCAGREMISEIPLEALEPSLINTDPTLRPHLVRAGGCLERPDLFDARFFDMPAKEARWMDPQHRLFLECAWEAIEDAGYDVGAIGHEMAVYAGCSENAYLSPALMDDDSLLDYHQALLVGRPAFLPTRVSYKLNLQQQSLFVDTACSTGLAAVHMACRALLNGECGYALAGGASVAVPHKTGYIYHPGFIMSPDGRCRAFDRDAAGTVPGNGVGVVLLKRYDQALRDGDPIYAVIQGSALNNDGALKVGYTAPSVQGQREAILGAMRAAGIRADSIRYVEAHGSGTRLGDPVEVAALTEAFRQSTERRQYCAIGSVKANMGHTDRAAGIAGLMKAALVLAHRIIPPSINLAQPNPEIDFAQSPFYINTHLQRLEAGAEPLRASVSSLGIGGTNAHLILQEAPRGGERSEPEDGPYLLPLSARTVASLCAAASRLADHLQAHPEQPLGDLAYTLQVGRRHHEHRLALIGATRAELIQLAKEAAETAWGERYQSASFVYAPQQAQAADRIAFLFTGHGAQYSGMGRQLYAASPLFRQALDRYAAIAQPHLPEPLLTLLFDPQRAEELNRAPVAHAALCALACALCDLWGALGIRPALVMGHSLGEYMAACTAGALAPEEALPLLIERAKLLERTADGAMASVMADAATLLPYLQPYGAVLAIAAQNGRRQTVVAGRAEALQAVMQQWQRDRLIYSQLPVFQAAHTPLVEPVLDQFEALLQGAPLRPLQLPLVSNLRGEVVRGERLDPAYWRQHLRQPVRFADGLAALAAEGATILLEIGPAPVLSTLAELDGHPAALITPTLRRDGDEWRSLLCSVAALWANGAPISWQGLHAGRVRRRVHAPTYAFDRQSYWLEADRTLRSLRPGAPQAPSGPVAQAIESDAAPLSVQDWLLARCHELLGQPAQLTDSFFALGGDSLRALQLHARIQRAYQIELELERLFTAPDLAAIAAAIEQHRTAPAAPPVLQSVTHEGEIPLSFAQQRLWFLERLEPGGAAYNLSAAVRLVGPLDVAAMERSLREIIRRHESLRTTFGEVAGRPVQIIGDAPAQIWTAPAIEGLSIEAQVSELINRPFDLSRDPMLRATLLPLGEQEHLLLLVAHHIAADGWSMGVMVRELAALYTAFHSGRPPALPALPIQYKEFAIWQRQWLQGAVLQERLAYWQQRLAGLAVLQLPADRPRPPVRSLRGATRSRRFAPSLTQSLRQLGQREGATLFMTLLAAFEALLYRYSGQNDLSIGTPIANRSQVETEELIGFFVNTLVMRGDLSGNPTFRELLARVRESTLGAYRHQDLPFEELVRALQPARSLSHNPLFQVMFILQNAPLEALQLPGLTLSPVPIENQTARFDIELHMQESEAGMTGTLIYSTDLFDAPRIDRLLAHFEMLLQSIVADPGAHVATLPLLTADEQREIAVWQGSPDTPAPTEVVHHLVEAQAARTPHALALRTADAAFSLTYQELDARANEVAHRLRALGAGPEVLVGLCAERSPALIIGLLAILKAGAACVPLDPQYPQQRLAYMLQHAAVRLILTQRSLSDRLPADRPLLCMDDLAPEVPAADLATADVGPSHLVYVIYTSGSTGQPKAIGMEHGVLARLLHWQQAHSAAGLGTPTLQFTTLSFDVAFQEIFSTLTTGGTLVLLAEEQRKDLAALPQLLQEAAVERLFLPFVALQQLAEACDLLQIVPTTLREVITAGEQLQMTPALVRLFARLPGCTLHNQYGPSESHVVTAYRLSGSPESWPTLPPIGKPVAAARLYLLDAHLQPVPVGIPGEIYIGGLALARGYLQQPHLTAERWIPDPFGREPGARAYRTGDLARYRPDGQIEFLGRSDAQVKVRGFRVEPGEIEMALAQHRDVAQAIVVLRGGALVAYVVPDPAASAAHGGLTAVSLRAHLAERLPAFMLPATYVRLEALPLTPSGKVDRLALPEPDASPPAEAAPPRTPIEEVLCAIWAHLLGRSKVSIHDSFFALGGDSLLATQVMAQVRRRLQVELPVRHLFEAPTVAALAARVEEAERAQQGLQAPAIERAPAGEALPLSFAQQRLWLVDQLQPGSTAYHITALIRLQGALDRRALEQSLREMMRRHTSLRTRFVPTVDGPVQVIGEVDDAIVTAIALPPDADEASGQAGAIERERRAIALLCAAASRPFDLRTEPLLRAALMPTLDETEHLLLLTMHHIAADGWSISILMREMTALYGAFAAGRAPALPALSISYGDFAHWQRLWLQGEVRERMLAYWTQRLAGLRALALPTDRPRPPVQGTQGATHTFALTAHLTQALKALSQREGATLFMTLLAAFQLLLHRYTGQDDIAVGTPIANRNRAETEGLIGFFANTLVMRSNLAGNPPFVALLAQVREMALGAYLHQEMPFEQVVDALQPARDLSRTPLFSAMFVLQNTPAGTLEAPGLRLTLLALPDDTAKFDLTLSLSEGEAGLAGALNYNTDLFDATTIDRMIGHYQHLLSGIVAHPEAPLSDLPLLGADERQLLLESFCGSGATAGDAETVIQLFQEQAAQAPDRVALLFGDQALTYRHVNARANQLAHYLSAQGVGPEMVVALCMERSPDLIIAMLAILKAGGAYLPLNPANPTERMALIIAEAQAPLVLADAAHVPALAACGARLICPAAEAAQISQQPTENLAIDLTAEHLVYVMYTSGSTGRPKGVAVAHRGVVRLVREQRFASFTADEVFLQLAPAAFDASTLEIWGALLHGARLALMPPGVPLPDEVGEAIARYGVSTLWLTAGLFHLMVEQHLAALKPLRQLLAGGDALSPAHVRRFLQEAPHCRLINGYGPTENTTFTTCCTLILDEALLQGSAAPIGRPIAGTTVYVLDRLLQPVPIGVPGELYTGGAGLARGYLHRPDLTAAAFVPNPFAPGILYRTGDLVRYRPDGALEFLGRIDRQVKVRGFRVEMGEIEAVLAEHPAVSEAVVVARKEEGDEASIIAYIVSAAAATGESHVEGEIRAHAKRRLPAYMLPSAYVLLERFPLTANGKVDRRALPAPASARPALQTSYVAPRSPIEELLAAAMAQVLWPDRSTAAAAATAPLVGIDDNFFELGGNSLLATQVISRIRSDLRVELPLRALFEEPSVRGLARRVEAHLQHTAVTPTPILPVEGQSEFPLSFAQQRLWFIQQLQPADLSYHIPVAMRLVGPLDIPALERSLQAVIERHESLRTTFAMRDGRPVQVIHPAPALTLAPGDEAVHTQPFDLARDPLLRATLRRESAESYLLMLTMHHIAADGWSIGILIREVAACYAAYVAGQEPALPPLPIRYADFACWQRQWLQGAVRDRLLAYWTRRLANLPTLALPTDWPRPAVQSTRGASEPLQIEAGLLQALYALSRREGATLFMTLLAAFQLLLHRYTGQDEICVGTPIANRNRAETEGLIGFFVNTLVMRTDLAGEPTFRLLLARVREMALGAYLHQDLPFEQLVEALQPERHLNQTPLFQTLFVLQNAPLQALELPGLRLTPVEADLQTAKFDLTLTLQEVGEGAIGSLRYRADLFAPATIARMARHYERLLAAVVANPDLPISRLSLLTPEEQAHLTAAGGHDCDDDAYCVHQKFEEQVRQRPEAIALQEGERQLTYREVNSRANRLARQLQRRGVGPERLVGLLMERKAEVLIGLLAILKAGGAYLPIDTTYPPERIAYMLADAQVELLLTERAWLHLLPPDGPAALCLDEEIDPAAYEEAENLAPSATADHLCYVIYTSGSTGRPKGTGVTHRNLLSYVRAIGARLALPPGSSYAMISTLAADGGNTSLFLSLCTGGCLHLFGQAISMEPEALARYLRRYPIDCLKMVVSHFAALLHSPVAAHLLPQKWLILGGEALGWELVEAIEALAPRCKIMNHYGPTETTVGVLTHPIARDPAERREGGVPLGGPLDNAAAYVLDRFLQPVPTGAIGELYLGGSCVARGYVGRPDLTAERFMPNPFGPGRLYKSGDLARYLPDGSIAFLGRRDDQVKIRGYRIELREVRAALLQHAAVQEAAVLARTDAQGHSRLVAYVVPAPAHAAVQAAELREALTERLPDYMIPSAFVPLPALPLMANGKLDRKALPAPAWEAPDAHLHIPPRTQVEQTLAAIWSAVLGVERISVRDSFFALGGDSILSIQVVAQASRAGLKLTPRQIFEHQRIEQLAAVVEVVAAPTDEQGAITGPVPLTPIQRRFFADHTIEPHHYNQAIFLQIDQPLDAALLTRAVAALQAHHDALRLQYTIDAGAVRQMHGDPATMAPAVAIVDLSDLTEEEAAEAIAAQSRAAQRSFDLAQGPLLRVIYFARGALRSGRLLLIAHHLVIDGVSWRILLTDLQAVYDQLCRGEPIALPPKSTSYKRWAERLVAYADSAALRAEAPYWLALAQRQLPPLPVDRAPASDGSPLYGTAADAATVEVVLSAAKTQALLHEAPAAYRTQITDILLTALATALGAWAGERGAYDAALIHLEGHGREEIIDGADLSRTVGWFTSIYPVLLDLSAAQGEGAGLMRVTEQLRAVPNRGIGYGLLRYCSTDAALAAGLAQMAAPWARFNYLGQLDQALAGQSAWRMPPADEQQLIGPLWSERSALAYPIDISAMVAGGQLRLTWRYSGHLFARARIERLAQRYLQALQALIAQGQAATGAAAGRRIEEIYPVTSLQQAMLAESLRRPGIGIWVTQVTYHLEGPLDLPALQRATQEVVDHHAVLRTAFVWEEPAAPVQVTHREVQLPLLQEDWRGLNPAEQMARLQALAAADRMRGFDLAAPPLLRLTLIRLADQAYRLLMTKHHLLTDGWSSTLITRELLHRYDALQAGRQPVVEGGRPYRDYIAWLHNQDLRAASAFWRERLQGCTAPTPLPLCQAANQHAGGPTGYSYEETRLSAALTADLQALARRAHLTLNTLMQGAWASVLSQHHPEAADLIFGATVSGRSAPLPGIEGMVGLLINTLPVRAPARGAAPLLPWLRRLQEQQAALGAYEHSPLSLVHEASDLPPDQPLFESLLVFENYPMDAAPQARSAPLQVQVVDAVEQTHYPLTLVVVPGPELYLRMSYDRQRYAAESVRQLLQELIAWLTAVGS